MISREQQFAEKIHAYTLPRADKRENTRVKDLIDLVLLQATPMESQRVRENIRKTFERRNTHPVPVALAMPPAAWSARFEMLAKDCGLSLEMEHAFQQLAAYFANLNRKG
jgi:Nucleotidyl transferase AbiEii toxin, Type IV TA system